jgi:hypothetical protein
MKLDDLSKLANIGTVLLALIVTVKTCSWDDKLNAIELESNISKLSRDKNLFENELKFKIYDLAINAIKSKDPIQQEAAYLAVSTLTTDSTFKKGLLKLFIKSNTIIPEIKKSVRIDYKKEFSNDFSDEFK